LACVLSWLHRREIEHPEDILRHYRAHLAQDLLYGIGATDHRERSGIFSTADSILAAYRSETALEATRFPNFNAEGFVNGADCLYICSPGSTHARHAALVVTLLDYIREAIDHRPHPGHRSSGLSTSWPTSHRSLICRA
jgi:type IV secretory pathway TraG/TraD family ATPase VirD4